MLILREKTTTPEERSGFQRRVNELVAEGWRITGRDVKLDQYDTGRPWYEEFVLILERQADSILPDDDTEEDEDEDSLAREIEKRAYAKLVRSGQGHTSRNLGDEINPSLIRGRY